MFEKFKELFTEEVEVDTPVKKEVIQVEIPAPETPKKEDVPVTKEVEVEQPKVEEKPNFPIFFDEKDFDDISKETEHREIPKEVKREPYSASREENYNTKREIVSSKKEDKHFEPTPIISPVYGVLDKNYKKDDIVARPKKYASKTDANLTVDDVRNKAYGTLEDELESTLFGKTSIMFAKDNEDSTYAGVENDLKDTADALDLLQEDHDVEPVPEVKEEKLPETVEPKHKKREHVNTKSRVESLDDILNARYDTEVEPKTEIKQEDKHDDKQEDKPADNMVNDVLNNDLNNDLKSDEKLSESDLFNLIDNMYEKGDK